MITLYTGTPGSGKSLHAAKDIMWRLRHGGGLICNFPINEEAEKRGKAQVVYVDNSELSVKLLIDYARSFHRIGVEGQTLIIIDECQILFNARDWNMRDRNRWVEFFSQHRKYGYNVILICQNDRMIDRQIRALVEYEVRHRKVSNYGFLGMFITLFTGNRPWFAAIERWYGGNNLHLNTTIFPYRKKFAKLYDSYKLFDTGETEEQRDQRKQEAAKVELLREAIVRAGRG